MNYTLTKSAKSGDKVPLMAGIRRFVPLMAGERNSMIVSLGAIVCNSLATLAAPAMIAHAVDSYIRVKDKQGLFLFSLLLLGVYLAGVAASYIQVRTMGSAGRRLLFRLRNLLFTKLQELPVAFLNKKKACDMIYTQNNDTDKLNQFIAQALMQFMGSLFMMAGTALFLLALNVRLGLATLAPAIAAMLVTQATGAWVKNRNLKSLQGIGGMRL